MSVKHVTNARFLMLLMALAMIAILPLSVTSAHDLAPDAEMQPAQGLSCPAGYDLLASFEKYPYPGNLLNALTWQQNPSDDYSFSLASETNAFIVGWTVVGHPELGCTTDPNTNGTDPLCSAPDQLNEHFHISIDTGFFTWVQDPGDHGWYSIGQLPVSLGAGNHTIEFYMPDNNNGNDVNPSVGYQIGICGQPVTPPACTYTQGWYRNHDWPSANVNRNTPFYLAAPMTWYEAMTASPRGDAYFILAQQYVAAYLNVANGAPKPAALDQATTWFNTYPPGQRNNTPAGREANTLAGILDAFNNGRSGTPHCG